MNGADEGWEVVPQPPHEPVPVHLGGYELVIGQALADGVAWRKAHGDKEQIGLYRTAARALGIPGDITLGPGQWHPDCE